MDVQGKTVVILGLAGSGRAAAHLALERGANVIGLDQKTDTPPIEGARLELGPHRQETLTTCDLLVVSPGVPAGSDAVQSAVRAGVTVIGELGFAAALSRVPILAITGTNGKSTTTHFLAQLLAASGFRPFAGGNLGRPCSEVALLENEGRYDVAAIEVSSYQMELPGEFHPKAGVILNLTPDHLARHHTMAGYAAAKSRLFARMTADDLAVIPANDPYLRDTGGGSPAWLDALPGMVRDGTLVAVEIPAGRAVFDMSGLAIPGDHNQMNAGVAAMLALHFGADPGRLQDAIPRLTPLPHRMEIVAERDRVVWINDSKATNVAATVTGLKGLSRRGVLLLGGQAKGDPFAELVPYLGDWQVVTFGGSGPQIADELEACGVSLVRAAGMRDAMQKAAVKAEPGDVVLLSPGCASFDEFRNFEHRGERFRAIAQEGP